MTAPAINTRSRAQNVRDDTFHQVLESLLQSQHADRAVMIMRDVMRLSHMIPYLFCFVACIRSKFGPRVMKIAVAEVVSAWNEWYLQGDLQHVRGRWSEEMSEQLAQINEKF